LWRSTGGPLHAATLGRACDILDSLDHIGAVAAEPLGVQVLNKLRERRLPWLLLVVVELAELGRVQPELAGHLDVCVRESVALARVDPGLQSGMECLGFAHVTALRGGTTNI
jgi:hypothetical protein